MNTDLLTEINLNIQEAKTLHKEMQTDQAWVKLIEAWELAISNPEVVIDRYTILRYLIQVALVNEVENVVKFIPKLYEYQGNRAEGGETEFLEGRIRFALNEKEEAKRLFKIAFQKSEGRIPDAKNPDYLKLVTEK